MGLRAGGWGCYPQYAVADGNVRCFRLSGCAIPVIPDLQAYGD